MSQPLASEDVLFLQRLLRAEGLYKGKLDGDWGPQTEAAQAAFEDGARQLQTPELSFDTRSEANIHTLCLRAQREARHFLRRVLDAGMRVRIISGTRSYAEQDRLYQKGRFGNPGPVVTRARGGESNHNFGLAWDIGIFSVDGGYPGPELEYERAAHIGMVSALEWGGDWHGFVDRPHYQLATGVKLTDLRGMFEEGSAGRLYA